MPRRRVLDENQAAEVARRYEAGETIDQLAAAFGLSATPIRKAITAAGVAIRTTRAYPRVLDDEQAARAVDMYARGSTLDEIAAAFGCSRRALDWVLDQAGVLRRPRGQRGPSPDGVDVDEIVARYRAGASKAQLARELSLSVKTIHRWLLAAGVQIDSRRRSSIS